MKSIKLIILFSIGLLCIACTTDDGLFDVLPESDHEALEGMEKAFEEATLYNDSLSMCMNDFANCDSTSMWNYDNMFHHFNELFSQHHSEYSHNNVDDDHHHSDGNTVWHGSMMGHDDEHGNEHEEDPHGYEHNNETFEEMMHLREQHEAVHPG